jgi:ubiquinone/menaquinone biosynthesis C-methylase UbiE
MVHVVVSEGVHVDGIDILPAMLRVAWRHARWAGVQERASLARASGTSLPFARASYDRVYTESVLGFQGEADAQAMLAQIWRVLRPGGRYVANEAIWKRSTTPGQVATIYEASFRDFGLAQASEQAWNVDDWLRGRSC